jgi:hypothetical protein
MTDDKFDQYQANIINLLERFDGSPQEKLNILRFEARIWLEQIKGCSGLLAHTGEDTPVGDKKLSTVLLHSVKCLNELINQFAATTARVD